MVNEPDRGKMPTLVVVTKERNKYGAGFKNYSYGKEVEKCEDDKEATEPASSVKSAVNDKLAKWIKYHLDKGRRIPDIRITFS